MTHNERLTDRTGATRQYDVVIRGFLGPTRILGIMECKDHGRKVGPEDVDAFAHKVENVGANLRFLVSKSGFTEQALKVARHAHISCLSLLADHAQIDTVTLGGAAYFQGKWWTSHRLDIGLVDGTLVEDSSCESIATDGRRLINWFKRMWKERYASGIPSGRHAARVTLAEPLSITIGPRSVFASYVVCSARYSHGKIAWGHLKGDTFFDWAERSMPMPRKGSLRLDFPPDHQNWEEYSGPTPDDTMVKVIADPQFEAKHCDAAPMIDGEVEVYHGSEIPNDLWVEPRISIIPPGKLSVRSKLRRGGQGSAELHL